MKNLQTALLAILVMLMVVFCATGCREVGKEAHAKASQFDGSTEDELIRAAGPPTTIQAADDDCEKSGGTRELYYTVSVQVVGGWRSDMPNYAVVFCIDRSSKIVKRSGINW